MKYWRADKIISGILMVAILLAVLNITRVGAFPLAAEYDCSQQTSIPADQCEALVAVFNATGGENWSNNTGWLQTGDPCQWYGVACSDGVIVALDLFGNNLTGALPLEIGGFSDLKTLTINGNPLNGPIPLTITFMDLDLFHFHGTSLCEPADPTFQDWLSQIVYRLSSGIYCSPLQPTATLNPVQTDAGTGLSWPQLTLTALAGESGPALGAITPEPTPTKYWVESPTPVLSESDQTSSGEDIAEMDEAVENPAPIQDAQSFLADIPQGWLIVLAIPLFLIVIGVLLEMRDRRIEKEEMKNRPSPLEYGDIEHRQ